MCASIDSTCSFRAQCERTDENIAMEVAKELGGLPLAITEIVGFLLNTELGLRDALDMLRNQEYVDALVKNEHESVDFYYDLRLSNVWDVTFSRFDSNTSAFLNIVGFLDPDSISAWIFDVNDDLCKLNAGLRFMKRSYQ